MAAWLGFTCRVAVLTGLVFGLAHGAPGNTAGTGRDLKHQAGHVVGGHRRGGLRKFLGGGARSLSCFSDGAGLFIQSLRNLRELNPGFT